MNAPTIGLRREDINRWERRAPLTPREVARLVREEGLRVRVQPSDIRVFDDASYEEAGATVAEDLSPCDVIFAVKEIPPALILPGKVYAFFAHVVKGQAGNMAMLAALRERGCSLLDYERIVDAEGRRLVFFGRFAGLAGMVDTLWALGKRLAYERRETPFAALRAAWQYADLEDVRAAVKAVGERLAAGGVGEGLAPLLVAFAGYGNVSRGAQEILDLLPVKEISPAEVAATAGARKPSAKVVYKVVFKEEDMVEPRAEGAAFDLRDYYDYPAKYRPVLARYLPHLTVLVNCIYWDPRYPHFVSKRDLGALYRGEEAPRLRVLGDISCDVEGGIEATVKTTAPDSPIYVYDVGRGVAVDGVAGRGPVILAVYNLPAELPRDASAYFGRQLEPYAAPVARADWGAGFGAAELPAPVKAATILYRGEFTPPYQYLERYLS
jgi:alpha-aminoadipic semialdehyde synthase